MPKEDGQIQCDLKNHEELLHVSKNINPEIVIHAVGNKNISFCETNPKEAYQINCDTIKNVASVFAGKAKIIYISTDYVFDGMCGGYAENDVPNPKTVYGKSKLSGEIEGAKNAKESFITVRLSALYDPNATFLCYLRQKLSSGQVVECFSNIRYSPTYVDDFLKILEKVILSNDGTNVFHACGKALSRYEFALFFAKVFGFDSGLLKKQLYTKDENLFLFPDLSLSNKRTCELFGIEMTKTEEALLEIKKRLNL